MKKISILTSILVMLLLTLTGCSKEVSERQWDKAFLEASFKNCQLVITDDTTEEVKMISYANKTIHLNKGFYNTNLQFISTTERYYHTDELGNLWQYWYDNFENKWYRGKTTIENPEVKLTGLLNEFAGKYQSYEYNKNDNAFKRIVGNNMTIVTFNKNKVSKIEKITNYNSSNSTSVIYEFSNYGATSLTLPTI